MYGEEIENILNEDKNFMGCYASDKLPSIPTSFPKSIIISTANSDVVGEHLVTLVMYKKMCLYFDSFGLLIINVNVIIFFIDNQCKEDYTSDIDIK